MKKGSWNKGYTKDTHPSVLKISRTMREKHIDNFKKWRDKMRELGKIKSDYPVLSKNGDLAELIGVILGDGYIGRFPRAEVLRICSNANNPGFISRYADLIESTFGKRPSILKRSECECVNITLYEKHIGKRLGIRIGSRKDENILVPKWILRNKGYIKRYLRGLYEAEGAFSIHKPTYTYKFIFTNMNDSLLKNTYNLLKMLGFHPHVSSHKVQISKKEEAYRVVDVLNFRKY